MSEVWATKFCKDFFAFEKDLITLNPSLVFFDSEGNVPWDNLNFENKIENVRNFLVGLDPLSISLNLNDGAYNLVDLFLDQGTDLEVIRVEINKLVFWNKNLMVGLMERNDEVEIIEKAILKLWNFIKKSTEEIWEFFSTIGHELRTPLNGLQIVHILDSNELNEEQCKSVENIKTYSESLLEMFSLILNKNLSEMKKDNFFSNKDFEVLKKRLGINTLAINEEENIMWLSKHLQELIWKDYEDIVGTNLNSQFEFKDNKIKINDFEYICIEEIGEINWVKFKIMKLLDQNLVKHIKEAEKFCKSSTQFKMIFLEKMNIWMNHLIENIQNEISSLYYQNLPEKYEEYLDLMFNCAKDLSNILEDILDYSRLDHNNLNKREIPFGMKNLVKSLWQEFNNRIISEEKNNKMFLNLDPNLDSYFLGDPGLLRQILSQLLDNAIKFSPEWGDIKLNVNLIKEENNLCEFLFVISDSGIWIPEEKKEEIFEPFHQLDNNNCRKYGGLGLWLPLTKGLVEILNWTLMIKSFENKGTNVFVRIKFKRVEEIENFEMENLDLTNKKILITDPSYSKYLSGLITSWWAEVEVEFDPETIYNKIKNWEYDFVILKDLEIAEKIQPIRSEKLKLFLTPIWKRWELKKAEELGINAYITKPVSKSDLYNTFLIACNHNSIITRFTISEFTGKLKPELNVLIDKNTLVENNEDSPEIRKHRILLVEDNKINQKVAKKMLEKLNCDIDLAVNGREAINMFQGGNYDLIFMDCQMPIMDGYEATVAIRKLEGSSRRIPIIALTANNMVGDKEKCLQSGMDEHISKPIRKEDLNEKLHLSLRDKIKETDEESPEKQTKSILLVEDEFVQRTTIMMFLKHMGYDEIEYAVNGNDALNKMRRFNYWLILMDCQMPELDGYETTVEARKSKDIKRSPIIALTAHTDESTREKCLHSGMDAFISKPINLEDFTKIMYEWMPLKQENDN